MASANATDRLNCEGSLRAARTAKAIARLEENYADLGLTPARTAASLGISLRYLERLLEMSGKSFGARVMELRLASAFALLASADGRGWRVSDVALQCGFSDVSHFTRSFRARYGHAPSAARV